MKKMAFWIGKFILGVFLLVVLTSCGTMDYKARVYGYVLSDPDYMDPVQGVEITLRVTSADDVPDYFAVTDEDGFYEIEFETGFKEEEGHFLPNDVVTVSLTYSYGEQTYTVSDLRVSAGSSIMVPVVYLSQFSGGK